MPVLATLVLGVVDVGRVYRLQARLVNAAREGATYAQYFPSQADGSASQCADPDNIAYRVRHEDAGATSLGVTVTDASQADAPVTGCLLPGGPAPGHLVVVTASAPFTAVTPMVGLVLGGMTTTVRGRAQAVVQG